MFFYEKDQHLNAVEKPVFSNGPKSLCKNPPDCTILCNWVFGSFTLADELIAKALQRLKTCVLVNNLENYKTHH